MVADSLEDSAVGSDLSCCRLAVSPRIRRSWAETGKGNVGYSMTIPKNPPTPKKPRKKRHSVSRDAYTVEGAKKRQAKAARQNLKKARKARKKGDQIDNAQHFGKGARTALELQEDAAKVSKFLQQGWTTREIAHEIGRTDGQVLKTTNDLLDAMAETTVENIERWRHRLINYSTYIYREANDAWQVSKEDKESLETTARVQNAVKSNAKNPVAKAKVTPSVPPGLNPLQNRKSEAVVMKVEGRDGDPRFLAVMDKCVERIADLLGLASHTPTGKSDPFGEQENARALVMSRLASIAKPPDPPKQEDKTELVETEPIDIEAETVQ